MKILVLGCNGMAGHMISSVLADHGHDVTGFARKSSKFVKTIIGNAENIEEIRNVLFYDDFDYVINCIGILNEMAEKEKSRAILLNTFLPHYLADIVKYTYTRVIQISTDCVFSGKIGKYTESSFPDGETFYDRTKALGEITDQHNITLRTSIIGPDINKDGIGLFNWFMKQEGKIKGYTNVIWTGITTLELSKLICHICESDQFCSGLYNAVPDHSISKYSLLNVINDTFKNGSVLIEPYGEISSDKSLVKSYALRDIVSDSYELMITELYEWMKYNKIKYDY